MLRRQGDDLPTESLQIVAAVNKTNMQGDHQEMMENFKPKAQGTIQTFGKASPNKEKVKPRGRPKLFLEQEGGETNNTRK